MNIAEIIKNYYEHEDFKGNYIEFLFEDHDAIIERIEKIVKHEYYFAEKYGNNMQLSNDQLEVIYQYILDNLEDFISDFRSYYVGCTSLDSISYGEQEEQLTGLTNHKTGKLYTISYLRKIFDKEGYCVNGDYAYYDMSGEGLHVDLLNSDIPILHIYISETLTLKSNPALMTVICNIQSMRAKIDHNYNSINDFNNLEKLTGNQLHKLQNELIPEYNKAVKQ